MKKPVISSGACTMNSRYHFMMSADCSISQSIGPAQTVCTGCAWNRNDVTTPKFPPPPRMAQNRSLFSSALAVTKLPSANTRSADSRLSMVNPYFARQVPETTAQREPADSRASDNSRRHGEPEGVRGVVHIAPTASAAHANRARTGVDMYVANRRQVDHQHTVGHAQASGVVASAANRYRQVVGACEPHGSHHVGSIHALRERCRLLVDHRVIDFAGILVTPVLGRNDFPRSFPRNSAIKSAVNIFFPLSICSVAPGAF